MDVVVVRTTARQEPFAPPAPSACDVFFPFCPRNECRTYSLTARRMFHMRKGEEIRLLLSHGRMLFHAYTGTESKT